LNEDERVVGDWDAAEPGEVEVGIVDLVASAAMVALVMPFALSATAGFAGEGWKCGHNPPEGGTPYG
jgi:hypothetical protein